MSTQVEKIAPNTYRLSPEFIEEAIKYALTYEDVLDVDGDTLIFDVDDKGRILSATIKEENLGQDSVPDWLHGWIEHIPESKDFIFEYYCYFVELTGSNNEENFKWIMRRTMDSLSDSYRETGDLDKVEAKRFIEQARGIWMSLGHWR